MHTMHGHPLDTRRLHYAVILADEGSFMRAAKVLNLSQPALTRSIQALEQELGLMLFDRVPTGVRLTPAGERVVRSARAVLREERGLRREARLLAQGEAGRLVFGCGPMFAAPMASILARSLREAPHLEIRVENQPVHRLTEQLFNEEIEFFVADVSTLRDNQHVHIEALARLPVGYFVRAGHPVLDIEKPTLSDLERHPFAAPEIRWNADDPFEFHPSGYVAMENMGTLKAMTLESDAVLLITDLAARPEVGDGRLRRVNMDGMEDWVLQAGIVQLRGRTPSRAATRIKPLLRAALRQ